MTMTTLSLPASTGFSRVLHLAGTMALRLIAVARAYKSRHEIQMLGSLDDRMLADIGLTRGDLRDAAAEPLWHDPTAVLVARVRERKSARGSTGAVRAMNAPPASPDLDEWSSRLFPPRSRYY